MTFPLPGKGLQGDFDFDFVATVRISLIQILYTIHLSHMSVILPMIFFTSFLQIHFIESFMLSINLYLYSTPCFLTSTILICNLISSLDIITFSCHLLFTSCIFLLFLSILLGTSSIRWRRIHFRTIQGQKVLV